MLKKIPFFDYPKLWTNDKDEYISILNREATSGGFILQKALSNFETELATFSEANYSIGVGNATDAMQLLLVAEDIGANDEVLFCSHTMSATASAIKSVGAKPIPVNCNNEYLIDHEDIKSSTELEWEYEFLRDLFDL